MIFGKACFLDGYVHQPLQKKTLEYISNIISAEEYETHVREHSSYALYRIGLTDELEETFYSMVRGEELPRSAKMRLTKKMQVKSLCKDSLCYCPLCMQEEMERYGEPYWHRLHQLPGVTCCITHKVKLVPVVPLPDIQGYFIPAFWVYAQKGIVEPVPELDTEALELAMDIEWLLQYGFDLNIRHKFRDKIGKLDNFRAIINSGNYQATNKKYSNILDDRAFTASYHGCFYETIYYPNYLSIILFLRVIQEKIEEL